MFAFKIGTMPVEESMSGGKSCTQFEKEGETEKIIIAALTKTACSMGTIISSIQFRRHLDVREVAITVEIGFLTAEKPAQIPRKRSTIELERLC